MKLEILDDTTLRGLAPSKLIAHITTVQRFIDQASAYQQRLITLAEQHKTARSVGDINIADTLVRETGISHRRARHAQRQARTIARQPEVADALATGAINTDQAESIARAKVTNTTRRELLQNAIGGEPTDVTRRRAIEAEAAERDETPEERFIRQRAARFLRFYGNRDGMVCMNAALDPENGARLKAKITAFANRMWRNDKHLPTNKRRTPQQREIDALCAATNTPTTTKPTPPTTPHNTNTTSHNENGTGNSHDDDSHNDDVDADVDAELWADFNNHGKRVVPVLRVSTSLEALRDGLHQANLLNHNQDGVTSGVTDSGEWLPVGTLRRLACDAEIIPTVLNGKSRIIDVGRRTRIINEALRCVLTERDQGCIWPGCEAPPSRCDAHHIQHWADGGPTEADNLALLCHRHHILLHEAQPQTPTHQQRQLENTQTRRHPHYTHSTTPHYTHSTTHHNNSSTTHHNNSSTTHHNNSSTTHHNNSSTTTHNNSSTTHHNIHGRTTKEPTEPNTCNHCCYKKR